MIKYILNFTVFNFLFFSLAVSIFGQNKIPSGAVPVKASNYSDMSFQKTGSEFLYRDTNTSHLKKKYNPDSSDENFILYNAQKYAPDAFYILSRCPGIMQWNEMFKMQMSAISINIPPSMEKMTAKFEGKDQLLFFIEGIVHECHHGQDFAVGPLIMSQIDKLSSQKDSSRTKLHLYHLNNQEYLSVSHTDIFPSIEIAPLLPESDNTTYASFVLQMRISKYINNNMANLATQADGIYGLLEELSAYYEGMKAFHDFRKYYEDQSAKISKKTSAILYLSLKAGNIYSGREFKYFILTYLLYAEKEHPEIYKEIINNRSFLNAFLTLDAKFETLVRDAEAYRKGLLNELEKSRVPVHYGNDIAIIIDKKYIIDDWKIYNSPQLEKALNQKELTDMMKILETQYKK